MEQIDTPSQKPKKKWTAKKVINSLTGLIMCVGLFKIMFILLLNPVISLLTSALVVYNQNGNQELFNYSSSFIKGWGIIILSTGISGVIYLFTKPKKENK